MDKIPVKDIFTQNDRLCSQCYIRCAASKDWLCNVCRQKLEAVWKDVQKQRASLMPYHSPSLLTELHHKRAEH